MDDWIWESVRAVVLAGVLAHLSRAGKRRAELSHRGWRLILGGFALLLLGSILDITDNFEPLSRLVICGNTRVEAFLEKMVGYLGGFVLLGAGLARWIPTVAGAERVNQLQIQLEKAGMHLKNQVRSHTAELAKANGGLQRELARQQQVERELVDYAMALESVNESLDTLREASQGVTKSKNTLLRAAADRPMFPEADADDSNGAASGESTGAGRKKILIVDDDETILRLFTKLLDTQYQLATAGSGQRALEMMHGFRPDLVLLDVLMPGIDGYETCRRIKAGPHGEHVRVIMLSALTSEQDRRHGFEAGADDYLPKPVDAHEVRTRIRLHFQLRNAREKVAFITREIDSHNSDIKRFAEEQAREIIATHDVAVFTLARVTESRDGDTGEHLLRMRFYSQFLAQQLQRQSPYAAQIDRHFLDDLYRSSVLHDVGKVAIPDAILLKPGPLTPDEFGTVKQHVAVGGDILDEAVRLPHGGGFLAMAAEIARFHHERFDGTGYLAGLAGEEIPLPARIVAVADVFDALTSVRCYKPAYPLLDAKELIEIESGRHFDPAIVEAFLAVFDDFAAVYRQHHKDQPVSPQTTPSDELDLLLACGDH